MRRVYIPAEAHIVCMRYPTAILALQNAGFVWASDGAAQFEKLPWLVYYDVHFNEWALNKYEKGPGVMRVRRVDSSGSADVTAWIASVATHCKSSNQTPIGGFPARNPGSGTSRRGGGQRGGHARRYRQRGKRR